MPCDLITNQAGNKSFEYCRIHKVESKDCPGVLPPPPVVNSGPDKPIPRSVFRVGDRVRRLDPSMDENTYGMVAGRIYTVNSVSGCVGALMVEGIDEHYWMTKYFELVKD